MIWWLFGHLWWGLPSLLALAAAGFALLGAWPLLLAFLSRIPPRVLIVLVAVLASLVAGSGLYGLGKSHGRAECESAQEAAEARADAKAAKAGARADKAADEASAVIKQETDHASDRARVIVREVTRDCPLPVQPDELRDLGREAVDRARRAM